MKHLFSIIFLFKFLVMNAQVEFAPVGATWYFNVLGPGVPFTTWDAARFKCTGTKDIQGKICKEIKGIGSFFQDGEKVFYFDEEKQKFKMIYNFAAKKGDIWFLSHWKTGAGKGFMKDSSQIKVDSVYTTLIAGVSRKVQNISIKKLMPNGGNSVLWFSKNIEGIGNEFFILPGFSCCEFPYVGLRCYESNGQKFSTLKPNEICDKQGLITKTEDIQEENVFLSLDRQNAFLKFENQTFQKGIFNLYDTQGNLAATYPLLQNHNEYRFDISNLTNGMYFWHLVLDDKVRQTGKMVVMKE